MDYIWYTAKQTYKQNYSLKPNTKLNPSKINIRVMFSKIICLEVTSKTASRKFLNMSTYASVSEAWRVYFRAVHFRFVME